MGAVGRLAALPCGKVSKWIVLALWIVAVAVSFGPAGKLTGAQDNDAVSWLPGNAESTEVSISSTPGIATVAAPRTADGLVYLEGTMTDAVDTQAAKDTVDRVRASVHAIPGR
jgi:RND superfamily putative drug exporter